MPQVLMNRVSYKYSRPFSPPSLPSLRGVHYPSVTTRHDTSICDYYYYARHWVSLPSLHRKPSSTYNQTEMKRVSIRV